MTNTLMVGRDSTISFGKGYASITNISKLVSTSEYYSFPRPMAPADVIESDAVTDGTFAFLFFVSMSFLSC